MSAEDEVQVDQAEQLEHREVPLDLSAEEVGHLALANDEEAKAWMEHNGIKEGDRVIVGNTAFITKADDFFTRDRAFSTQLAEAARRIDENLSVENKQSDEVYTEEARDELEIEMADTGIEAVAVEGGIEGLQPDNETVIDKEQLKTIRQVTDNLMGTVQTISMDRQIDAVAKEQYIDRQVRTELERLSNEFHDQKVSKETYALLMTTMLGAGSERTIDQIVGDMHAVVEKYATRLKSLKYGGSEQAESGRGQIIYAAQQEQSRLVGPDQSVPDTRYFILAGVAAGAATGLPPVHAGGMMHAAIQDASHIRVA